MANVAMVWFLPLPVSYQIPAVLLTNAAMLLTNEYSYRVETHL